MARDIVDSASERQDVRPFALEYPVHPTVLDLGFATIKGYGLMIALAIPIGFWVVGKEAARVGLQDLADALPFLFFWIAAAFFLGGKLAFALGYREAFEALYDEQGAGALVGGGFVYWGALILAIPVTSYALKQRGLPILRSLDALVLALPIAHGFGRLGCFLAGCCYGSRCDAAWAVTFEHGQGLNHISLHPVQIYEASGNLLIFLVLWLFVRKQWSFSGRLILAYLLMYSVLRLVTETFRGDGNPEWVGQATGHVLGDPPGGLTQAQVISIVMFALVLPLMIWRIRQHAGEQKA